jgi:hypothetical protein
LIKVCQFSDVLFVEFLDSEQNPLLGITLLVIGDNDLNASARKTEASDVSE